MQKIYEFYAGLFIQQKLYTLYIYLKKYTFFLRNGYAENLHFFSQKFFSRIYAYFIQKFISENHYSKIFKNKTILRATLCRK